MPRGKALAFVASVCWFFIATLGLAKTELVINGTFDTDVTGWTPSTAGTLTWDGSQGHAAVGAAWVANRANNTSQSYSAGAVQCVNLPSPLADYYTVEGWVLVPNQANASAQGYVRLQFYAGVDCTTSTGTARDTALVGVGSPWTFVSRTALRPANAMSVQVRLYVKKDANTGDAHAYFDDISLYSSTPNAVAWLDPDRIAGLSRGRARIAFGPEGVLVLGGLAFGILAWALHRRTSFRRGWAVAGAGWLSLALLVWHGSGLFPVARTWPSQLWSTRTGTRPNEVISFREKMARDGQPVSPWLPRDISPPGRRSVFLDPVIPDPPPWPAVKLVVSQDGLYVVRGRDVRNLPGWDPSADPRTFRLVRRGQEVAIWVEGAEDGRFDPDDRLVFYGEARHGSAMWTKYGDAEVYWLTWGGRPGRRVRSVLALPQADASRITRVLHRERLEEDREWYTHHTLDFPTRETWWWARLRTQGMPVTREFNVRIPAPAEGTSARLRYEVTSRRREGRHRVRVTFNGQRVDERTFVGHTLHVFTTTVPAPLLTANVRLAVTAFPTADGEADLYVDGFTLTYTRTLRAENGYLEATIALTQPATVRLTGFADPGLIIWDVADTAQPQRLVGWSWQSGEGEGVVDVGLTAGRHRLVAVSAASLLTPAIRPYVPTSWRDPRLGADLVIVTSSALRPAAERLAEYRRQQGYRVVVAEVERLYDAFAWGWEHPEAIRAFLAYAFAHWQPPAPRYLLLLGSGHWNFKALNTDKYGPLPPNHVPPYLAWVDPWQGEVPVDQAYVTFAGNDDLPEMIVGRIPARTLDEANAVVDKIMAYERGLKKDAFLTFRRWLVLADRADPHVDYERALRRLVERYRRPGIDVTYLALGSFADPAQARAALLSAWSEGMGLILYAGHGSVNRWSRARWFTDEDVPALARMSRWPVLVTLNCLDGYFAYPRAPFRSLAATLLIRPDAGVIAAWSPAGLGTAAMQEQMAALFLEELLSGAHPTLGDVVHAVRLRWYAQAGPQPLFFTQTLLGDPLLRVPEWHSQLVPFLATP